MSECKIFISCNGCGFKDIPENFNVLAERKKDRLVIYVQCPACERIEYFQELSFKVIASMLKDSKVKCASLSHLFCPTIEETGGDKELAMLLSFKKYREFKRTHGKRTPGVV